MCIALMTTTAFVTAVHAAVVVVDTGGADDVGESTSLAVVAGNPAISYWDELNDDLKYVQSFDIDGASWPIPSNSVDSAGAVGRHTSLTEVDGEPAISYWDETNGDLKFAQGSTVPVELMAVSIH